jgi:hypothetical protein
MCRHSPKPTNNCKRAYPDFAQVPGSIALGELPEREELGLNLLRVALSTGT